MDPQYRSSFIPKNSLSNRSSHDRPKRKMGIIPLLASVAFVLTLFGWAGLFGYSTLIQQSIEEKGGQLQDAQNAIDKGRLQEFRELDQRLRQIERLTKNHRAVSLLFAYLQSATLRGIQFTSFDFSIDSERVLGISMDGVAPSLNAVTLQAAVFEQGNVIQDAQFSMITRNKEDRKIMFDLQANINPDSVRYAELVDGITDINAEIPEDIQGGVIGDDVEIEVVNGEQNVNDEPQPPVGGSQ